MKRLPLSAALFASVVATTPVFASDCSDATASYNTALSNVSYALRRYGRCLVDSRGKDDCSYEFRRLKYAQDELVSAVSDISSYCQE